MGAYNSHHSKGGNRQPFCAYMHHSHRCVCLLLTPDTLVALLTLNMSVPPVYWLLEALLAKPGQQLPAQDNMQDECKGRRSISELLEVRHKMCQSYLGLV